MGNRLIAGTDILVSPIGLGTVKLGRTEGVKYPTTFKIPTDSEAAHLLNFAKNLGINLIDTAPAYGNSEQRLGELLKNERKDWVICTKTGEVFASGQSTYNFTEAHTRNSIEQSLKNLQTDYLDIVLVHSDGNDVDIINRTGVLEVLADLKSQGKIRAIGMSIKTVEGGILALQKSDIAMVTYNPSYLDEKLVLDYALANNKGIFIKKALGSGHLIKTATNPNPAQTNIQFILKHQAVSSIIIGSITPANIQEVANATQ